MEAAKLREIIRTIFAKVRFHGKKVSLSRAGNRELSFFTPSLVGVEWACILPHSLRFSPVSHQEPLVESVEYVSVARKDTMEEIMEKVEPGEGAIISLALRLGKVRLIDNIIL